MKLVIPNGCKAEVILPNGNIYNILSGNYEFECDLNITDNDKNIEILMTSARADKTTGTGMFQIYKEICKK